MQQTKKTITPQQAYNDNGLIYIRYHATIEEKANGQKKIENTRNFRKSKNSPHMGRARGITIPY